MSVTKRASSHSFLFTSANYRVNSTLPWPWAPSLGQNPESWHTDGFRMARTSHQEREPSDRGPGRLARLLAPSAPAPWPWMSHRSVSSSVKWVSVHREGVRPPEESTALSVLVLILLLLLTAVWTPRFTVHFPDNSGGMQAPDAAAIQGPHLGCRIRRIQGWMRGPAEPSGPIPGWPGLF